MKTTDVPVIEIIKSIFDLEIKMFDDDDRVIFSGILKDKSEITVDIHLSIAPSLQSMLSREGQVHASCWVKVNGNCAGFEAYMKKTDMKDVGGFLADAEHQVQSQLDLEASTTLMHNLKNKS